MNKPSTHINISDRIRSLAKAGHSRAEIARIVDRSYQQVRQVLVADEARARRSSPRPLSAVETLRMAGRAIDQVDVSDLETKSAKMRRYASQGFSRTAIAEYMGVKYQFVRNVLVAEEARAHSSPRRDVDSTPDHGSFAFREPAPIPYQAMPEPRPARLQVDASGRVQLPRDWAIAPGSVFIARNFMGDLVLMDVTRASEAARIESMSRASDALIAERRLEAMREFDD
jgi:hypothetical protein